MSYASMLLNVNILNYFPLINEKNNLNIVRETDGDFRRDSPIHVPLLTLLIESMSAKISIFFPSKVTI